MHYNYGWADGYYYDIEYWLWDGVHPTSKGHEFIKREWIKAFRKHILQER